MIAAKKIFILLATRNGQEYLTEQIKSIQGQTISNWTLLVRDDNSQDDTAKILHQHALEDKRIRLQRDHLGRLGATRNFGALMATTVAEGADVVFFSDQDDVWFRDKISKQLQSLHDLEARYGTRTPLLTYCDMEVVDERLRQIHPSFMRYQRQHHEPHNPVHVLLTQNFVAGCTIAINRPLLEFATPVPDDIRLHDWWLALCAGACGHMAYIDEPLVRYRQHSSNEVGAVTLPGLSNVFAAAYRKRLATTRTYMWGPTRQAAALSERLNSRNVNDRQVVLDVVDQFASCITKGLLARLLTVYRLPLRRQGLARNCLWFLRLVLMRKRPQSETMLVAHR